MCSRRGLLQGVMGLGLMASFAPMSLRAGTVPFPHIGAQVYTVREAYAADPLGTLKRLKAIGYDEVELTGLGGVAPKVLRQAVSDMGLKVPSMHIGLHDWRDRPEAALRDRLDRQLALPRRRARAGAARRPGRRLGGLRPGQY
ncbi:MAG: hypothetical protein AAGC58_12555, partial [Asticcacaulis sp.]